MENELTEFLDWVNNNWYEPTVYDGMWRLRVDDPEYELPKPEVNFFTSEEIVKRYNNSKKGKPE